jgi:hypothetical protein
MTEDSGTPRDAAPVAGQADASSEATDDAHTERTARQATSSETGEAANAEAGEAVPASGADEAARAPTVVKRVVCSYHLGWLPGEWLQTWRRLDRVFARANLRVKATLAPLEDLPADTDILVVPPELRDDAREAAPVGTPILVTPASAAAGAFAELVARLESGTEFTAEKFDPEVEKSKPKIVSYRGHTILD